MNANEIAFGIEFETTLPNSDTTPIGPYHHGYQVPWLPTGWRAERDASIKPETPNRKGCEFVSPKLKGLKAYARSRTRSTKSTLAEAESILAVAST